MLSPSLDMLPHHHIPYRMQELISYSSKSISARQKHPVKTCYIHPFNRTHKDYGQQLLVSNDHEWLLNDHSTSFGEQARLILFIVIYRFIVKALQHRCRRLVGHLLPAIRSAYTLFSLTQQYCA